jgi:hypothetical protein
MQERSLFKPLLAVASVTALLLLLPLVAMQATPEVRWGPGDFLAAALLLSGTGTAMVLAWRYARSTRLRVALVGFLALALAVVWAELAVGLFT